MLIIATVALAVAAFLVLAPSLVFLVECLASLVPMSRQAPATVAATAILVPAHDESASIGPTVVHLKEELGEGDRILVVADNCSDDTAEKAEAAGAEAIRRDEPSRRGKGYALRFGVEALAADPPDVVIVVDADCRVSSGSIRILAAQAATLNRPVQAEYTFTPATRTPLSMVSTLALLVRNRVRPRGLRRLGLPCQLTGSGMGFPWTVLRDAPPLHSHLVEDLLLGAELAKAGRPPFHSIEAEVTSVLPTSDDAARQQRTRWEHGQLGTLSTHGPELLWTGMRQGNLGLVAMGADLLVPPLALLVAISGLTTLLAIALRWLGGPTLPLWVAGASLGCIAFGVGVAWLRHGRDSVPFRYLLAAPLYLLWKAPLYLSFTLGRREREWRRTQR